MEEQRVAGVSSIKSTLNSASKKHDKTISIEKSGDFANKIENSY